ncbi:AAA family ATPase [Bacteroides sp. 519]|uniref:AAA family ATPase n=1 Tax=Bacteroides sp. 519 TaxID=2302937 RepID=UPI0013D84543|nr:AAA family ATPase [Bacteroides sp. 519]NDV60475.1 mobilization protein [Bacteroides sp. 519]
MEYGRERKPMKQEDVWKLWQQSILSITSNYEKAPEVLKIDDIVIGTLGNFSASIGKAKSKKTFNVSAIVAAALKNGMALNYSASFPADKSNVIYIDTEQSSYHCLKVMKRILRLAGLSTEDNYPYLQFLALRKNTPEERIAIIDEAIYKTNNVGLVVIDGIRDLVYDINSPSESTYIISKLMQWTDEKQIHLHTILHQNKGDENARGHIGTELSNKAETILQVEKDKADSNISKVEAVHIRAMDFKPFAFRINEQALPEIVENYVVEKTKVGRPSKDPFDPYKEIRIEQHEMALISVFAKKEVYGYEELQEALVEAYNDVDYPIGRNKVTKVITFLRNKRIILQENGKKYSLNPKRHY